MAPLVNGDIALRSSRLPGGVATAEIVSSAGRQLALGRRPAPDHRARAT